MNDDQNLYNILNNIIELLEGQRSFAEKVDNNEYGWKTANRNFRRNVQEVRRQLKDLRNYSLNADNRDR